MRAAPRIAPPSAGSPLLWFAVLGAPLAWVAQFAVGYWVAQTRCGAGEDRWDIGSTVWMAPLAALAAAVATAAALTALALLCGSAGASPEGPPPGGRTRFLAVVGIAVAPLFLLLIALTALGVAIHVPCNQS